MIDVALAIDAESETITWRQRSPGSYDGRGNGIGESWTDTQTAAAIQPVSGRELQDLPEGVRSKVTMVGWTRSEVAENDQIIYRGDTYRVYAVRPRPMDGFHRIALGKVSP